MADRDSDEPTRKLPPPATCRRIWVAMADLKAHVLNGHSFEVLRGPVQIPIILAIVAITVASFFLNAVFAFAITRPRAPEIRPAVARAQSHVTPILVTGAIVGLLLALSTTVVLLSSRQPATSMLAGPPAASIIQWG